MRNELYITVTTTAAATSSEDMQTENVKSDGSVEKSVARSKHQFAMYIYGLCISVEQACVCARKPH